jgi:hypothetical protein
MRPARELIMSDGGIGDGLSYWATINIRGQLSKEQLQVVVKQIKSLLAQNVSAASPPVIGAAGTAIDGEVKHAARMANTSDPEVSVTINGTDE